MSRWIPATLACMNCNLRANIRTPVSQGVSGRISPIPLQGSYNSQEKYAQFAYPSIQELQRGGSVTSDVRFGSRVFSPMVPLGQADFLIALEDDEVANNMHGLREDGVLITPGNIDVEALTDRRGLSVALLGVLSAHLRIGISLWREAVRTQLAEKLHEANEHAFALGRAAAQKGTKGRFWIEHPELK